MTRENWGSRFGFIMATAGFAIGMGNIWRFPYITGQSGGGAFILVYLIFTVLIGIPLLTAEISLGRKAQLTPIAGMKKLAGDSKWWVSIGWVEVIAAILIMAYYLMIMGWVGVYVVEYLTGKFSSMTPEQISTNFDGLVAQPGVVVAYSFGVAVLIGIVLTQGLQGGVERISKIFMPMLLGFFVILAIGSNMFEGSFEGLKWYLSPDFSKINGDVILAALGQVFFSIGVGLAGGFVFGSYLDPKKSDVPGSVALVVAFDTAIAIVSGLVIFPALFAFGMEPDSGPGLLFVTMASLFSKVPYGDAVGAFFFILVFVAGLTSILGLVEAVASSFMDSFKVGRRTGVIYAVTLTFVLSIPSILSFGPWSEYTFMGKDFFNFTDYLSGSIMLPLGGLLISLFVAYKWGFEQFKADTNEGAAGIKVSNAWKLFLKVLIPVVIAIILINGLMGAQGG
ncbi:MAG: sodium-dependent transporter [Cyclobacteriaceae bacterium]